MVDHVLSLSKVHTRGRGFISDGTLVCRPCSSGRLMVSLEFRLSKKTVLRQADADP